MCLGGSQRITLKTSQKEEAREAETWLLWKEWHQVGLDRGQLLWTLRSPVLRMEQGRAYGHARKATQHNSSLYLRAKKQNNTTRLCDSKDSLQEIIFLHMIWYLCTTPHFFCKGFTYFLPLYLSPQEPSKPVKVFPAHHLSSIAFLL